MSQHNEKNPHQHQSPLHDSSEAKPGMDSLAPGTDLIVQRLNQHRRCTTYRPWEPGKPLIHVTKNLILWKTYAKAVKLCADH